jgi:hypothetical protein
MDKPTGASFELSEDPDASERHASCKGNPATNDWIPSADTVGRQTDDPGCLFFLPCTLTIEVAISALLMIRERAIRFSVREPSGIRKR